MRSIFALLGLVTACSKDSGSLFGWTVDDLEVEVDALKTRADSSESDIISLRSTVDSLTKRIEGIEASLACPAGSTLDTCKCSAGSISLPWVNNGGCVDESAYVCQQEKKNYNNWRLPRTADGKAVTQPSHYNVKLHLPGLYEEDKIDGAFHFSGETEVLFTANEDICFFSLHLDYKLGLLTHYYKPKVSRVIVTVGGVDVPVTFNLNAEYIYLTVYLDHKITAGSEVSAIVHYENEIPTGTKGLYLSHYTNPAGQKRYLLATQYESTAARMTFPCFDEPDLKATFDFEISYMYQEYTAIFNMDPVGPPTQVGDRYTVKYQRTMKLPTYLLAMLISDFNLESSGVSADGVKVRILGRPEWANETKWALEDTLAVVDGLSEKFGYKYCDAFPGPTGANGNCKSDQASIPQFGAGAMENWGLITYREYYMHIDQARDPFRRKYYSTSIIGHELIHQWFGNLVTCPWWDEIYINEAFGSIGGYLGLIYSKSHEKINYQWEDEYLIDEGYRGMYTDGTALSRPMVNNVNNGELKVETPQECSNQFDNIAYPKSGSVMLMIRAVLGDDLWTQGLRNYLNTMKFDVSTGDNLLTFWDGVVNDQVKAERLGGMTPSEAFEPFFKQMGLPALKINEFRDELGNLKISVSSSRYLNTKHNKLHPSSSFKYVWNVPVVMRENGVDTFHWIKAGETSQVYEFAISENTVIDPESNIWMRINFNQQYIDRVTNLTGKRQARSISKMIRDHMTFLTEETRDEYDVDLEKVLSLLALIDPSERVEDKKIRWGQWAELSQLMNNKVWNVFTTYLSNVEAGTNEENLYNTFTDHIRTLVNFWKADGLYPDVQLNDPAEDKWYGDWSRLNQFLLPLARRFDSAAFAVDAIQYISPVVDGSNDFMELSPDSRADSFYAAVQAGDQSTIQFALNKINEAVDNGMDINNIRLCRSTDSASSVSVGLYTGDCRENVYFIALSFSKNIATVADIASKLPKDLVGYYFINVAARDDMAVSVTRHIQSQSAMDIENNWVSGQFTSFVETSCNYFSTMEHRQLLRDWSNKAWNAEFRSSLSASLTICENTMTANEELMDLHYESFTSFYCKMDTLTCGENLVGSPTSYNSWYLPKSSTGESHYKPTQYYVDLNIRNLTDGAQEEGNFYYDGTSQVEFTSTVALDSIHIHVDKEELMKITGYVVRANGKVVPVRKTVHNSNRFLFSFYLDATIPAETPISLIMNYNVQLTPATEGLYLSNYEDEYTGETLYLLATQFESTHARECFPCFDEPQLKAQFKFSIEFDLGKRQDYTAIYNMDIQNSVLLPNNRQRNYYYNSMPMPTYLNAILVSPFNTESKGVSSEISAGVRILGRPEWADDTDYARNEAMSIVDNFSKYFDWDYCHAFKENPQNDALGDLICKTDQTGIPQFRSGAMENWGLITYREYYLHYNSQRDNNLVRRTVTRIVGHELIHQWFGNLITCKWWDEIYINEAWGSIGGYLGLQQAESNDKVEYEWEDEYLTTQGYSGFTYDGRITSRPMVNNANNGLLKVETPREISSQFDSIAYNKAGSVMMMIREVIGQEKWLEGLRKYLKDNQYTNPTWREQLLAWDQVVPDFKIDVTYGENDINKPENITEAFKPYFLQMGYPLLKIEQNTGDQYTIRHSRFMSNVGDLSKPDSDFGYQWNVPLIYTNSTGGDRKIKWIKTECEEAITILTLFENAIIDPNANTWLRIKFSDDILSDYAVNNRVNKRQAAKIAQDAYQMAVSPRYNEAVKYADVMQATKLFANFRAQKQNWIVYREMTYLNTFASRLLAATMDDDVTTGQAEFAEAFRSYMFDLADNNAIHNASDDYTTNPERCYPDEDVGLVRDESKARMAPYVTQTQLYYAPISEMFFVQAKQLADKLLDGSLPFLEQSADTRPDTFIGAVIKEESNYSSGLPAPVISHFINRLQSQTNTDFKCSSTQLSYPLYSTEKNRNCELHRYWNALLSIRTRNGYYKLYEELPVELQPLYTVEAAANKYLYRFIVDSFATNKTTQDVKDYLKTPARLNSLISNSCSYMTIQSDYDLQQSWNDELLDWTDDSGVNIRETRDNCLMNILSRASSFQRDYKSVREWLETETGSNWGTDTIQFAKAS